jgi:hypothetical protein
MLYYIQSISRILVLEYAWLYTRDVQMLASFTRRPN